MKSTRRFSHFLSLFLLIAPFSRAQDAAATKGKAIGETINAAISAALPGVSAIENIVAALFKKPAGTAVAPTATAKVSAQDVTNAVNSATTTLQNNAQAQLSALQGAVAEIAAANQLASAAQNAYATLPSTAFLNIPGGLEAFKNGWGVAKTNLGKVTGFNAATLGKITDESLLTDWNTLNNAYAGWISDIETNITNQTQASITTTNLVLGLKSFGQLQTAVQGMTMIPSVELTELASQLSTIKAQQPTNAANNASPPRPHPHPKRTIPVLLERLLGAPCRNEWLFPLI